MVSSGMIWYLGSSGDLDRDSLCLKIVLTHKKLFTLSIMSIVCFKDNYLTQNKD